MVDFKTITFQAYIYNLEKNEFEKWPIRDFDHLFEREGYLNIIDNDVNPEIIILRVDNLSKTVVPSDIFQKLENARAVIFVDSLQNAASCFPPYIIPDGWPKRTYYVLYGCEFDQTSKSLHSHNVVPIFYDFCYHSFRESWLRIPYKSYLGWQYCGIKSTRFFEIAEVNLDMRERVYICVGKTRPYLKGRLALEELFTKDRPIEWSGWHAFKSYHDLGLDDVPHLFGMMDDPINICHYDPRHNKIYSNQVEIHNFTQFKEIANNPKKWNQSNLIHKTYYEHSYISIYGESIERGVRQNIYVSEKTYAPLINGHFILPYASSGFIDSLKEKGFLFPDFINYDYTNIDNDEIRLEEFLKEIKRLMSLSSQVWHDLYLKNINIIHFNRQKFWTDPFPKLNIF
jgi:hypothetical protein